MASMHIDVACPRTSGARQSGALDAHHSGLTYVLGAKTDKRGKSEAWDDIRSTQRAARRASSESVPAALSGVPWRTWTTATASGGALEALIEMRVAGANPLHRHHRARPRRCPSLQLEALRRLTSTRSCSRCNGRDLSRPRIGASAEALLAEAGHLTTSACRPSRCSLAAAGARGRGNSRTCVRPVPGSGRHQRQRCGSSALAAHAHRPLHGRDAAPRSCTPPSGSARSRGRSRS